MKNPPNIIIIIIITMMLICALGSCLLKSSKSFSLAQLLAGGGGGSGEINNITLDDESMIRDKIVQDFVSRRSSWSRRENQLISLLEREHRQYYLGSCNKSYIIQMDFAGDCNEEGRYGWSGCWDLQIMSMIIFFFMEN